jgi:hypothetical protein
MAHALASSSGRLQAGQEEGRKGVINIEKQGCQPS